MGYKFSLNAITYLQTVKYDQQIITKKPSRKYLPFFGLVKIEIRKILAKKIHLFLVINLPHFIKYEKTIHPLPPDRDFTPTLLQLCKA